MASPRDDEQQALLRLRDQPSPGIDAVPRDDQVHTLGGAYLELATTAEHLLQLVDPYSGCVDRLLRADGERVAGLEITNRDAGYVVSLA
jgi:hypothetical protein